ncbi:CDP-diacylglycerol--serine O-phosphatidyltransferase [Streptomyces sp. NPDC059618]|uniref:CDP-diacylglycerol--serine O-phosphatidyltransferase n=1 Tax=Streptomyces sp. NPDC059618 TaxID=3346887 RepID=UPI0036A68AF0
MTAVDVELSEPWASETEAASAPPKSPTRLSVADVLTLGNAVCGFASVYFTTTAVLIPHLSSGEGAGSVRQGAAAAVMLVLLASLFDLCDGLVARRFRSSGMGAELDNLSDLISFGLSPAYFVVVWGIVSGFPLMPVAAAAVAILLAGLLRLARFSVTEMRDGMFQGMPIPFAALTVLSLSLLEPPFLLAILGVLAVAWLMISRIEYPKPSGRWAVLSVCWIMVNVGCLISWAAGAPGAEGTMVIGCMLQVALAALLPVVALALHVSGRRTPSEA